MNIDAGLSGMNRDQVQLFKDELKFFGVDSYVVVGINKDGFLFMFGEKVQMNDLALGKDKQTGYLYVESNQAHKTRTEK